MAPCEPRIEGMENAETQSSQFVSTMANNGIHRFDYLGREREAKLIAKARRVGRKDEADDFREEYYYGRGQDKKTCIWSGGRHSWPDRSSGITWIGVQGKDTICVVTKSGALDISRVHGLLMYSLVDEVFRNFRRAVISEIEDLADPCSELRKKLDKGKKRDKCIKMPFGVVSVVPLSAKVKKASCYQYKEKKITQLILEGLEKGKVSDDEDYDQNDQDACLKQLVKLTRRERRDAPKIKIPGYDEKKIIKFMQDEMKNGATTINETVQESGVERAIGFLEEMMESAEDFSLKETVKTAICAFQRLFNKKFKANEIEVSVMDPEYFVLSKGDWYKDIYVNHLERIEIDKYLSEMSEQEQLELSD